MRGHLLAAGLIVPHAGLARRVAREIVNQVMSSINEGGALLLEKLLRVLRENANRGLEQVDKQAQPQPD